MKALNYSSFVPKCTKELSLTHPERAQVDPAVRTHRAVCDLSPSRTQKGLSPYTSRMLMLFLFLCGLAAHSG